jgi:hypothetical protein
MLDHLLIPHGIANLQPLKIILDGIDLPVLLRHLTEMQLPHDDLIAVIPVADQEVLADGESFGVAVVELFEFVFAVGLEQERVLADQDVVFAVEEQDFKDLGFCGWGRGLYAVVRELFVFLLFECLLVQLLFVVGLVMADCGVLR